MNTKNNQRARITRMLMKQAYLELMNSRPASKITVKDICELAEVNRSTFYLHYAEPNDILMELEDDAMALVADSLRAIGALRDASPDTRSYLMTFLHNIQRNDGLFRALLVENTDPHFRRKLQAIALGMAETSFDVEFASVDKNSVYLFIVSGSIELISDWIKSGYAASDASMCRTLFLLCEGSLKNVCE